MRSCVAALVMLAASGIVAVAHAAWDPNGNVVVNVGSATVDRVAIAADGAAGAFVAWTDVKPAGKDLYLQRITAAGIPASGWPAAGIAITQLAGDQTAPQLLPDGAGGVFVCWEDRRNAGTVADIYAQRITAGGQIASGWAADGKPVIEASGDQLVPRMVADGAGGIIVAWFDQRVASPTQIFAQRLNGAGQRQWNTLGAQVSGGTQVRNAYGYDAPQIAALPAGGAIVTWTDTGTLVFVRHLAADGTATWEYTQGESPLVSFADQPAIVSDGSDGAWIAFRSFTPDYQASDLRMVRVGSGASNVIDAGVAAGDQWLPQIVSDLAGGAVAGWLDFRNGGQQEFAQRVTAANAVQSCWAPAGQPASAAGPQELLEFAMCPDGRGGALFGHSAGAGSGFVLATHLTPRGTADAGFPGGFKILSSGSGVRDRVTITSVSATSAIAAWRDARSGSANQIYAQLVTYVSVPGEVLSVTATGRYSAKLEWSVPAAHPDHGAATGFELRYSLSPITEGNFESAAALPEIAAGTPGSPMCQAVDGLLGCRTYYFALRTRYGCEVASAISNVPSGKTKCSGFSAVICDGSPMTAETGGSTQAPSALEFALGGENPARDAALFRYAIPARLAGAPVDIRVLDVAGRRIRGLAHGAAVSGRQSVEWDLTDEAGHRARPGLYLVRMRVGTEVLTARVMIGR